MARYILLMTLTPEGRERMAADPERVLRAASEVRTTDTHMLGLYGVLGNYDFVAIIESSDNAGIARFLAGFGRRRWGPHHHAARHPHRPI